MNQLPLRPNVCVLVFNSKKELFLGERFGESGIWQFPQGGVEDGLTLEENVLKELEEELGPRKDKFRIVKKLKSCHEYNFQTPPKYAQGKWRGQSQTFWLVEFLGKDSDLDLEKKGISQQEFSSFRWCRLEEIRGLVEPKRLPGYLGPLGEYEEYLKNLASFAQK